MERRGRRGSFNWSRSFEMESKRRCKRIAVYPSRGRNTVIVILIESEGEGKVRRNAPALTRPLERRPRSRASVLIKWKSRVIERSSGAPPFNPTASPPGTRGKRLYLWREEGSIIAGHERSILIAQLQLSVVGLSRARLSRAPSPSPVVIVPIRAFV